MKNLKSTAGHTILAAVVILVVAAIGATGVLIWHKGSTNPTSESTATSAGKTSIKKQVPTAGNNQSQNVAYLYIKEWNVKVALPQELQGKVAYGQIATATDPDTGLTLEATKIYVAKDAFDQTASDCAVINAPLVDSIDTGAQYIKSDNSKPFNSARYKGTFEANILKVSQDAYHLNYILPDCLRGSNAQLDAQLFNALGSLKEAN